MGRERFDQFPTHVFDRRAVLLHVLGAHEQRRRRQLPIALHLGNVVVLRFGFLVLPVLLFVLVFFVLFLVLLRSDKDVEWFRHRANALRGRLLGLFVHDLGAFATRPPPCEPRAHRAKERRGAAVERAQSDPGADHDGDDQ